MAFEELYIDIFLEKCHELSCSQVTKSSLEETEKYIFL